MDYSTLAATATATLAPYLAEAGKELAKKTADAAWQKLKSLHEFVRSRLARDPYATTSLQRFEEDPHSVTRQAALTAVLSETLQGDPEFSNALKGHLDDLSINSLQAIKQSIAVTGTARDINQIGTVGGDLSIGKLANDDH